MESRLSMKSFPNDENRLEHEVTRVPACDFEHHMVGLEGGSEEWKLRAYLFWNQHHPPGEGWGLTSISIQGKTLILYWKRRKTGGRGSR